MAVDRRLRACLSRWGLRLRLVEGLTWGAWGAAAGLAAGLGLALAARLWPLLMTRSLVGLAGALTSVGAAIGLTVAWLRPRPLPHLARVLDRRLGLAERLTTAVEIGTGHLRAAPALAALQLADTLDAAARADPRKALPLHVPRWVMPVLGALAAPQGAAVACPPVGDARPWGAGRRAGPLTLAAQSPGGYPLTTGGRTRRHRGAGQSAEGGARPSSRGERTDRGRARYAVAEAGGGDRRPRRGSRDTGGSGGGPFGGGAGIGTTAGPRGSDDPRWAENSPKTSPKHWPMATIRRLPRHWPPTLERGGRC